MSVRDRRRPLSRRQGTAQHKDARPMKRATANGAGARRRKQEGSRRCTGRWGPEWTNGPPAAPPRLWTIVDRATSFVLGPFADSARSFPTANFAMRVRTLLLTALCLPWLSIAVGAQEARGSGTVVLR